MIRDRLTYANVVATLALFLVLAGGVAVAAKVAKKSVGPSQLKASAVTTAKIKANAVTTRKIRRNAVSNAKIKDGAVESLKVANRGLKAEDIDLDSLPFGLVVDEARGSMILALATDGSPVVYPLSSATYTQPPTENDSFLGALDIGLAPSCEVPREVTATLAVDAQNPAVPTSNEIVAAGSYVETTGGGPVNARVELSPVATRFEPGTATTHRLTLTASGSCTGGAGSINALFGGANVIGTK
ncbi:MAG TPA: hypothetical protein VIT85_02065 [Solirubrobacterales bacterium]